MTRRALTIAATLAIAGSALMATTTAAAEMMAETPHPAHIHEGLCPQPGGVVAPLTDVAPTAGPAMGPVTAVPVEVSMTTVELPFADILAAEHSINVHQSADALDVYIACGNIGGLEVSSTDLAIGLSEQNASHHVGAAWLHDNGDGTTMVSIFLVGLDQVMAGADEEMAE